MVDLSKAPSSPEDHILRGLKGLVQWVPALRHGSHCPASRKPLPRVTEATAPLGLSSLRCLAAVHTLPRTQLASGPERPRTFSAGSGSQSPAQRQAHAHPTPPPPLAAPQPAPPSEACSGIQGRVSRGLSSVLFSQGCGPARLLGRTACHSQQAYPGSPARLWLRPLFGQVLWVRVGEARVPGLSHCPALSSFRAEHSGSFL